MRSSIAPARAGGMERGAAAPVTGSPRRRGLLRCRLPLRLPGRARLHERLAAPPPALAGRLRDLVPVSGTAAEPSRAPGVSVMMVAMVSPFVYRAVRLLHAPAEAPIASPAAPPTSETAKTWTDSTRSSEITHSHYRVATEKVGRG